MYMLETVCQLPSSAQEHHWLPRSAVSVVLWELRSLRLRNNTWTVWSSPLRINIATTHKCMFVGILPSKVCSLNVLRDRFQGYYFSMVELRSLRGSYVHCAIEWWASIRKVQIMPYTVCMNDFKLLWDNSFPRTNTQLLFCKRNHARLRDHKLFPESMVSYLCAYLLWLRLK